MDDCLGDTYSITTATETKTQLTFLLSGVDFTLKNWCSNDARLLEGISLEDLEISLDFD